MLLVPKRVVGALAALRASIAYSAGRYETSIDLNCFSARWPTAKHYLIRNLAMTGGSGGSGLKLSRVCDLSLWGRVQKAMQRYTDR